MFIRNDRQEYRTERKQNKKSLRRYNSKMSTAARVAKNTGYLYAKMGITMFISLYTTRLILNSLGTSDFGIFNIVGGAIAMLGFLNAAMAGATQRFMSYTEGEGDKEKQKKIFNISIILHAGISVIVGVVLVGAGYIFFNGVLNIPADRIFAAQVVYGSLIVSTMFTVMSVPYDAMLNAHENMRYYAIVGIIESLLKLSVAFVVVYTTSDKLIMYGILMAAIPLITLSIMRIYCHRKYAECVLSLRRYFDRSFMKEMTGFAGWNFLGSISALVGNYGNGLVLNHFYGATLNAATGIANQLNGQLLVFSNNMLKAVNPVITKSEGGGNREKMLDLSTTSCKFAFAMLAFIAIPVIIEMPFIQKIWLKNIPKWAILFAQLQLVRTLIEQLTISYGAAIAAEGRIAVYNTLISLLNFLPVSFLFILFSLGYSPVMMYVLNISIFGILLDIVRIYFMHRNCGLEYKKFIFDLFIPVTLSFGISFVMTYIPQFFMGDGWSRLLLTFFMGVFSFWLSFWFISVNKIERTLILSMLRNIRAKIISYKKL